MNIEEMLDQLEQEARSNGVESMSRSPFWEDNDTESIIQKILSEFSKLQKENEELVERCKSILKETSGKGCEDCWDRIDEIEKIVIEAIKKHEERQ